MEIIESFVGTQNPVSVGEVGIYLIEVGPPKGLMFVRV
jgi:hypothetical protein